MNDAAYGRAQEIRCEVALGEMWRGARVLVLHYIVRRTYIPWEVSTALKGCCCRNYRLSQPEGMGLHPRHLLAAARGKSCFEFLAWALAHMAGIHSHPVPSPFGDRGGKAV